MAQQSPRKPWPQYEARTVFLRVPTADWLAVIHGAKTEFRAARGHAPQAWNLNLPTPVVAYHIGRQGHQGKLMVLEAAWQEALGAIRPESLAREGFYPGEDNERREEAYAEFRRYWKNRERKRFTPLQKVWCFRVRAWEATDELEMGRNLLRRLYDGWLP